MSLFEILGLINSVESESNATWNFYFAALSAVFVAVNIRSWQPNPYLIGGLFSAFALVNFLKLQRLLETKRILIEMAGEGTVEMQSIAPLLDVLEPSSNWQLAAFHITVDIQILAMIFVILKQRNAQIGAE